MNAPSPLRRSSAFTLIELLITVSVIAILAALVMPGVNSMIDSSRSATCASNLRHIGQALFSYANENDGTLPAADIQGQWPTGTYMHRINPYLENLPTVTFQEQLRALYGGIFHCPGKRDYNLYGGPTDRQRTCYAMNTFDLNNVPATGKKLVQIENRIRTILVADTETGYWALRNGHYMNKDFRAIRHKKQFDNILFCDGHVELIANKVVPYELVLED